MSCVRNDLEEQPLERGGIRGTPRLFKFVRAQMWVRMPRMKPLAPLLAAAILILCFFTYEQKSRIDQQAKAIADLSKEIVENKKTSEFL